MNKKSSDASPPKKLKIDIKKHDYPAIPPAADDEVSNERNLELLKEECKKSKLCSESIKSLMARTYTLRSAVLNGDYPNTLSILDDFPMLKMCTYVRDFVICIIISILIFDNLNQVKLEFELVMQGKHIKEEFDEQLIIWSKATILYCKNRCTKTTAIQSLVKNVDVHCKL